MYTHRHISKEFLRTQPIRFPEKWKIDSNLCALKAWVFFSAVHQRHHIYGVNYKFYLLNFPRDIFARIAIFWSNFTILVFLEKLIWVCLVGANALKPLFAYIRDHELYFDGCATLTRFMDRSVIVLENWLYRISKSNRQKN